MSAIIHALFDQLDMAGKAAADLEVAGVARRSIAIVEGGGQGAQEASHILDQHGIAHEIASTYANAMNKGGALLCARVDPAIEPELAQFLRDDGAISVNTAIVNDDADELSEAEGWDDFNRHGNEHSPDPDAESVWTGRKSDLH
jgi:hypothetical protein